MSSQFERRKKKERENATARKAHLSAIKNIFRAACWNPRAAGTSQYWSDMNWGQQIVCGQMYRRGDLGNYHQGKGGQPAPRSFQSPRVRPGYASVTSLGAQVLLHLEAAHRCGFCRLPSRTRGRWISMGHVGRVGQVSWRERERETMLGRGAHLSPSFSRRVSLGESHFSLFRPVCLLTSFFWSVGVVLHVVSAMRKVHHMQQNNNNKNDTICRGKIKQVETPGSISHSFTVKFTMTCVISD